MIAKYAPVIMFQANKKFDWGCVGTHPSRVDAQKGERRRWFAEMNSLSAETNFPIREMFREARKMKSPTGQMNLPCGQMNLPGDEMESPTGHWNLPERQMKSQCGRTRSPTGQTNLP